FEIECRPADYLEHICRCSLLLQRFAQLVEQASVLDGDDGLAGKILHQLDLFVSEWAHLLAEDGDRSEQHIVLEHRHGEIGANAIEIDGGHHPWIALEIWLSRPSVLDLHRPLGPDDLGMSASWMGADWHVLHRGICRWHVVNRSVAKDVSIAHVE